MHSEQAGTVHGVSAGAVSEPCPTVWIGLSHVRGLDR